MWVKLCFVTLETWDRVRIIEILRVLLRCGLTTPSGLSVYVTGSTYSLKLTQPSPWLIHTLSSHPPPHTVSPSHPHPLPQPHPPYYLFILQVLPVYKPGLSRGLLPHGLYTPSPTPTLTLTTPSILSVYITGSTCLLTWAQPSPSPSWFTSSRTSASRSVTSSPPCSWSSPSIIFVSARKTYVPHVAGGKRCNVPHMTAGKRCNVPHMTAGKRCNILYVPFT